VTQALPASLTQIERQLYRSENAGARLPHVRARISRRPVQVAAIIVVALGAVYLSLYSFTRIDHYLFPGNEVSVPAVPAFVPGTNIGVLSRYRRHVGWIAILSRRHGIERIGSLSGRRLMGSTGLLPGERVWIGGFSALVRWQPRHIGASIL